MSPQSLTFEQLAEVERLGALMFTPDEVCVITGYLPSRQTDPFLLAVERGRLREEALNRASIFELSRTGSAPAQTLAVQLINQDRVALAGS